MILEIDGEKFGPILHFIRYKQEELDDLIDQVMLQGMANNGCHTRILGKANRIFKKQMLVILLNRDIVGAVVGVQPFGGCGLSGIDQKVEVLIT